jgi:hypothetical protein
VLDMDMPAQQPPALLGCLNKIRAAPALSPLM